MREGRVADQIFERVRSELPALRRVPVATYRVQFQPAFTFRDAKDLVPYLRELGVTDCYASPYLQASAGSPHGYDVSDHAALNPDLGSEMDYRAFVQALKTHDMGQIFDMVPNHMGIAGSNNAWWMDVLENGPSSPYASFFDIDWDPLKPELKNKVLLPILGDQYGKVLENRELTLVFQDGAFFLSYQDTWLPIAPRQYAQILEHRLDVLEDQLGTEHPNFLELQSILTALHHLPPPTETDPEKITIRKREKEIIKKRLSRLCADSHEVRRFLEENVRGFNGKKGDPRSFDLLDALLAAQVYRLAYWRVAAEEINYRRFFDINELAAIRMEDPTVFQETHKLIFRLIRDGTITGLRIDHPDGLYEPVEYFRRLQRGAFLEACRQRFEADGTDAELDWATLEARLAERYDTEAAAEPQSPFTRFLYIVAEKILTRGERLPRDWPIDGTTGYDFMNRVNGLCVDSVSAKAFDELYARFIHARIDFRDLGYEKKKLIMHTSMSSEINVLGHQLSRLSEKNRQSRDFTLNSLIDAIRETIACFPVYRTYIGEADVHISESDRLSIERAVSRAKRKNPATNASVFDFIRDVLCLRFPEGLDPADEREHRRFVMKFQQCTGPVMAKGLEDTAFYIYNRLASLNEVGGDPERFGVSPASFHRENIHRCEDWRHSMLATSTHDAKRGEDVRARINVLSEIPGEWRACVGRWARINRKRKTLVDDQPAPDRNDEYLLYQTLVGAWPLEPMDQEPHLAFTGRIQQYMEKATKEAKVNTSWMNPNKAYDDATRDFVGAILEDSPRNVFLPDFKTLQRKVAAYGMYNSLSQVLLKIASPGVPDIYQGNEIWDFSLVDPDNRRPVDYDLRRRMLRALADRVSRPSGELAELAKELMAHREDGTIKLFVTWMALTYRTRHKDLFLDGTYLPLEGDGPSRDHVCAFARRLRDHQVLVVVPRLLTRLTQSPDDPPLGEQVWRDSLLLLPDLSAGQTYDNMFTGEAVAAVEQDGKTGLPLRRVFSTFPVALLEQCP
jgi:(1->4)-alpha-D-glucan 1-alpha-D-glucosylmutase